MTEDGWNDVDDCLSGDRLRIGTIRVPVAGRQHPAVRSKAVWGGRTMKDDGWKFVLTLALTFLSSPSGGGNAPWTVPVLRMKVWPIPSRVFQRRGGRESPLRGERVWVREGRTQFSLENGLRRDRKRQPGWSRSPAKTQPCGQRQFGLIFVLHQAADFLQ